MEEIIETCVEMGDAARMIRATMAKAPAAEGTEPWERQVDAVLAALLRGDAAAVSEKCPTLLPMLDKEPLLYVRWAAADIRNGSSPRGASNTCCAAC